VIARLTLAALLFGQMSVFDAPAKKGYVAYIAEPENVPAGKRGELTLRFHVAAGFHVNSHTPKEVYLIPTSLTMQPASGVRAGAAEFPPGKSYAFSFSPNEPLDVYSDDFTVKLPVAASAGEHEMDGELKYQACDKAACYPPRSLAVKVMFTAK
jgi:hypothetical protein